MSERVLVAALLLSMASCRYQQPREAARFEGETMGTTYLVQVAEPLTESERIGLSRAVQENLDEVDRSMSTYRSSSELSRFNATDAGETFRLSPGIFAVFEEGLRVSELTGGAFDVTVLPLVRLWGFGSEEDTPPSLPPDDVIEQARARTGYRFLDLSDDPPSLTKEVAGIECDLSAIAKGYGVDRVAEMLVDRGMQNFMVEVGGEVRTSGKNADEQAWQIAIEKPIPGRRVLQRVVPLSGLSMATSGDYRDFYEVDGKLYSHLIDPREGRPVSHRLASVSVVDLTCMRADALASGLLVLGPDEGYELAVKEDLAVLFLIRTAAGEIEERPSPSFEQLFEGLSTIEP